MGVATEFETTLAYGDPCPVCDREVRSTVEASGDGVRAYNTECVQYADRPGDQARSRYIFHIDGWETA
jgi:hypothetical protein